MRRPPITKIDRELCTGCGSCVEICPSDTLSLVDSTAHVTGDESMHCAQCVAVCPVGAVSLSGIGTPKPISLGGYPKAAPLIDLMMSRRSCRSYRADPVDRELLEDLVTLATWAPSGTNSQQWCFTIVPDRKAMLLFAEEIAEFFRKVNRMAQSGFTRLVSKIFMGDALGKYYRERYETVKQALVEWEQSGRERLFHGAPAAIVISTTPDASCAVEDALMASQNIVLAAEAIGLGTCLIGFAVEAMARAPSIGTLLQIPPNETVRAVIAVGHPAVKYHRPSGRVQVKPRYATCQRKQGLQP